jgi:hypothetical protein
VEGFCDHGDEPPGSITRTFMTSYVSTVQGRLSTRSWLVGRSVLSVFFHAVTIPWSLI